MDLMKIFGWVAKVLAMLVISSIWRGHVLTVLWGWFVVPTFGLPTLSLAAAIGLSFVISFLTYQIDATKEKNGSFSDEFEKVAAQSMLLPALTLIACWVVRQFM